MNRDYMTGFVTIGLDELRRHGCILAEELPQYNHAQPVADMVLF